MAYLTQCGNLIFKYRLKLRDIEKPSKEDIVNRIDKFCMNMRIAEKFENYNLIELENRIYNALIENEDNIKLLKDETFIVDVNCLDVPICGFEERLFNAKIEMTNGYLILKEFNLNDGYELLTSEAIKNIISYFLDKNNIDIIEIIRFNSTTNNYDKTIDIINIYHMSTYLELF